MIVRNRPLGLNSAFMRLCVIRQHAFFETDLAQIYLMRAPRQSGGWA
jgi:hypothetical protein